jgi:hypothetical protein
MPAARRGRGVAAQIALARRISPHRAAQQLGWASILIRELPATYAALREGRISEWRAMLVARGTAWLSREHRTEVDAALAPGLETLGDRALAAEVDKLGYRLDPAGYVARLANAEAERRVGVRPAPDVMGYLSALLPVAQAVACYAALRQHADTVIADGDGRSRNQLMADTLVARLTGQETAGDVPVEINLIMTDQALIGPDRQATAAAFDGDEDGDAGRDGNDGDEPAYLLGYGYVPAGYARRLALSPAAGAPRWLRRLYRRPDTGELAAMDSRRRCFTRAQRHFVQLRDQRCRTPWCGAPIRHIDHVVPVERGGLTSVENAAGLCEACNYAKQAPGWQSRITSTGGVVITTPTGHQYQHRPPAPPGDRPTAGVEPRIAALARTGRLIDRNQAA